MGVYKGRYSLQLAINEPHKYRFNMFDFVEGAIPLPDQILRGTWKWSMYQVPIIFFIPLNLGFSGAKG